MRGVCRGCEESGSRISEERGSEVKYGKGWTGELDL